MKIKSIKEIVNGDSDKELAHIIGEVVTKKEYKVSIKKKNDSKLLYFLVSSGNFCIKSKLDSSKVKNYNDLVEKIKIDKPIYLEGIVYKEKYCDTYHLDVLDVSGNIMLKKLEHEDNKSLEIGFLMEIFSGNEKKAVDIVNTHKELDVNFEYEGRIPVFSAVNNKMFDLFSAIINHPKFNSEVTDGFGESLLQSFIYLYTIKEASETERTLLKKLIDEILALDNYCFNYKDLNEDTAINIACEYPKCLWIVEALASNEKVNINLINDYDCSALTNAIRNQNTEAIKILAKRKDLQVRPRDLEEANKNGIDLSKFDFEVEKANKYAVATA